jgi:hypothetical protein
MGAGEEETVELSVQKRMHAEDPNTLDLFREQLMQLSRGVRFFPAGEGNAPAWARAYSRGEIQLLDPPKRLGA